MSLKSHYTKAKYLRPCIVLSQCFVEESICSASATITIGEPYETYSPEITDWSTGSQSGSTYEF